MIDMMEGLVQFLWPFVRISSMLLASPIFSTTAVSLPVRVAVSAVITLMVFQYVSVPVVDFLSVSTIVFLAQEITVGVFIGLTMQVVTAAIVLSGQAVSSSMGLAMANMIDPNLGNVPTLSSFFLVIGLLAFLSLGGHLVLISVLVESFEYLPIGSGMVSLRSIEGFVQWSSQIFIGAVALVLPVLMCLLMINVGLGVISRASPSLNIFAVGFPALIPVGLVLVTLSLTFYYATLETLWYYGFQYVRESLSA